MGIRMQWGQTPGQPRCTVRVRDRERRADSWASPRVMCGICSTQHNQRCLRSHLCLSFCICSKEGNWLTPLTQGKKISISRPFLLFSVVFFFFLPGAKKWLPVQNRIQRIELEIELSSYNFSSYLSPFRAISQCSSSPPPSKATNKLTPGWSVVLLMWQLIGALQEVLSPFWA